MQRIRFDPLEGPPKLPDPLQPLVFQDDPPSTRYYLVQFGVRVEDEHVAELRALGVEPLEYLPQGTFLARIPPDRLASVRGLPSVRWVGPFQPAFKVSENLDMYLQSDEEITVAMRVLAGGDPSQVAAAAAMLGAGILSKSPPQADLGGYLRVKTEGRLVPRLAFIEGLVWLEKDSTEGPSVHP